MRKRLMLALVKRMIPDERERRHFLFFVETCLYVHTKKKASTQSETDTQQDTEDKSSR